ncbi:PREDICTED: uncharacterized protein LOC106149600 isoform X3 [Chinchilla lanigera]|uniref:uncharacterized protein LOC106149600 isoform X3 n=1 Tax=Chinchilla lanigera TaxID=34839 RepID=UPI000696383F|nr:PREDICTED: uncharacterized protein LOC106149600 isoform X3 [Chinchilla lanigera]
MPRGLLRARMRGLLLRCLSLCPAGGNAARARSRPLLFAHAGSERNRRWVGSGMPSPRAASRPPARADATPCPALPLSLPRPAIPLPLPALPCPALPLSLPCPGPRLVGSGKRPPLARLGPRRCSCSPAAAKLRVCLAPACLPRACSAPAGFAGSRRPGRPSALTALPDAPPHGRAGHCTSPRPAHLTLLRLCPACFSRGVFQSRSQGTGLKATQSHTALCSCNPVLKSWCLFKHVLWRSVTFSPGDGEVLASPGRPSLSSLTARPRRGTGSERGRKLSVRSALPCGSRITQCRERSQDSCLTRPERQTLLWAHFQARLPCV